MKIKDVVSEYLRNLTILGRSPRTVINVRYSLADFLRFLESEEVSAVGRLTAEVISAYQQDVAFRITAKGSLLSLRSQAQLLAVTKGFTRYLKDKEYLIHDPGAKIQVPKKPKRLPKVILNEADIRKMMKAPDMGAKRGWRNRVLLEILYDTGIRRSELACITLTDLDLDNGYIHIRGKGDKDRVVPLSERVCGLAKNYVAVVRPAFIHGKDPGYLLLNRWGAQMRPNAVWAVVKRCTVLAGIEKTISPHTFRHTCATHMLRNGAPVRHVQELLGHESLESTQIYTRVTINDLKEAHAQYHPNETMGRWEK